MKVETTPLEGLLVIRPRVFEDGRGYFFESWSDRAFAEHGIEIGFVQDNQSKSQRGVLRGLHFQNPPHAQGKLVRVIAGSVRDIAVDIRKNSATYGQHFSIDLSAKDHAMVWIPAGFAHGFATLENDTIFAYKCSAGYAPVSEAGLPWNDADLGIDWGIEEPILSPKDTVYESFANFNSLF